MTPSAEASAARVRASRCGPVAVIRIDHAPVNSLSQPVRRALWCALEAADADAGVQAIVLAGAGRGFCGGGDLAELHSPLSQAWPGISNHLLPRIEACGKPVIAALHGFAVGGGFELALACHHRVARRDTRIALPEVRHGRVPPSGSQRLPRAIGVRRALDLIVSGETVAAERYAGTSLFDRLYGGKYDGNGHDGDVLDEALAFAVSLPAAPELAAALLRHRAWPAEDTSAALAAWRQRLRDDHEATVAMRACVDVVEFAVGASGFDAGLVRAKQLHDALAGLPAPGTVSA